MTLTFDLGTWFEVTAHPLPEGTVCVKYKPHWAKGKNISKQGFYTYNEV